MDKLLTAHFIVREQWWHNMGPLRTCSDLDYPVLSGSIKNSCLVTFSGMPTIDRTTEAHRSVGFGSWNVHKGVSIKYLSLGLLTGICYCGIAHWLYRVVKGLTCFLCPTVVWSITIHTSELVQGCTDTKSGAATKPFRVVQFLCSARRLASLI